LLSLSRSLSHPLSLLTYHTQSLRALNTLYTVNGGKKCCGISYPDAGSNTGTCMYKFWALVWECL
jgi:hypothetical protein